MMSRLMSSAVVAVALATVVHTQQTQSPQRPVFRSDAQFVMVDAYPLRDGRIAEGLSAADFVVREDGVPQAVELFEFIDGSVAQPESERRDPNTVAESRAAVADPRARAFVAYLDLSHVSIDGAHRMRVPLVEFLNRVIAPQDVFGVISSDHEVTSMAFGRRVTSVEDQLARYWAWGRRDTKIRSAEENGLWSCFSTYDLGGQRWAWDGARERPLEEILIDRYRTDRVLEHLEDLVWYLGSIREGRTSVLLVSEGWRRFGRDTALKAAVEATSQERPSPVRSGTEFRMFSTLEQGQRQACIQEATQLADLDITAKYMRLIQLANSMNVSFFAVNPQGLAATDSSLGDRVRGITPEGLVSDDFARLRERQESLVAVSANTDGVAVTGNNDLRASLQPVIDQLRSFYLLGYYSTNRTFDGGFRTIAVSSTAPGVTVKARRSYRAPTEEERTARANPVPAPELGALARALDILSAVRSSSDGIDVTRYLKADAAPLLGVPAMFRATPSPRSPLIPVTSPAYRRSERIHVEWAVTAAEPFETRTARLVGRDGKPLAVQVALSERPESPVVLVADAVLAALAPGDYAIELVVKAGGEFRQTFIPFRVVP